MIEASERVEFLEGRVVRIPNGMELASCGYANLTPWNCPRDDQLRLRQTAGGIEAHPVGSTSCREVIERHQPLMGLHGQLHESRGTVTIGRSRCCRTRPRGTSAARRSSPS